MSATPNESQPRLTPVASSERVELIDILRGFALLGILTVNFWGASGEAARGLDRIVSDVLEMAVESSFYPLFSFLFGLGFAVQLLRARERGAGVVTTYVRRMLALFLIGAFHAVVIWDGDILVTYAILGLVLVPLHRLSNRWLVVLAAVVLAAGSVGPMAGVLNRIGSEQAAETRRLDRLAGFERRQVGWVVAERHDLDSSSSRLGSLTSSITTRWHEFQFGLRGLLSRRVLLSDVLAFFMIGFVVGRRRILQEATRHRTGLTYAAAIGLIASIAGTLVVYVMKPSSPELEALGWSLQNYGATMFYISAISVDVTFVPAVARVFHHFAPAGRIGLTNYLLQSITMTLLFSRYGVALKQPPTALWLAVDLVFFFGVQLPFSRWWIRRFRFGPAEWVWRSLTYGYPQPMRLEAAGVTHVISHSPPVPASHGAD
jgi:uncharacterized protein